MINNNYSKCNAGDRDKHLLHAIDTVTLFVVASIFQKQDEGAVLLDQVYNHLGLLERQLFSLQIRESSTAIASITANTHSPVSSLFICSTFQTFTCRPW